MKFSSTFRISNKKRIITIASLVDEDQSKAIHEYRVHKHTIPISNLDFGENKWTLELIIVESPNVKILE